MTQNFTSDGQSIGISASTSVLSVNTGIFNIPLNISLNIPFNIQLNIPMNMEPGLISFRMNWLLLLAVQGNYKSLLQHHSSNASILWLSAL